MQTPYYHINEADLLYDISLLKTALSTNWGDNFICGYSVKTNSLPWLIHYLKGQGFYAEIVSEEEYALAAHLGFPDEHIIYNGPVKDRRAFEQILVGCGLINLDSHQELDWLEDLSKERPALPIRIGLRINCDVRTLCPDVVPASDHGGRFGYCYENGVLAEVIERLRTLKNVTIEGLHLHSSTQSRNPEVFAALAGMAVKVAREYDLDLSYIDMGGGYYGGRDDMPSYPDYFAQICPVLKEQFDPSRVTLIAEPGVSLISRCSTFVTSVIDYKDIGDQRFLVTDGSRLNLNPQVTRHSYPHHMEYVSRIAREPMRSQWICGFTCMEYDRLFEITDEPELMPGDHIVYDTAGGYTMCLNPLFIRYLPAVYITHTDGSVFTAREAWGLEEYLQKNHIE